MSNWVRVETIFHRHPKVLDIGPLGEALWLRGLCYAGEQLTDGFVPTSFLKRMGDMKAVAIAARLVDAGLWHEFEGGYQIHDFLVWQRSRDEVEEISSKRVEAGRRGGKQKASNLLAKLQQNASNLSSKTLPDTDVDTEADKKQTPQTTSSETPVGPQTKPQRSIKTPVPENLAELIPPEVWSAIGSEQGMSDDDLRFETENMLDHFRGNGERKIDWVATWRKWMRSPLRKPRGSPQPLRPKLPDGVTWDNVAEWRNRKHGGFPISDEQRRLLDEIDGRAAA